MKRELLPDELWAPVEPILPKHEPDPRDGRPRIPDRLVLTGIIFVLKSGIPWEMLPQEMGCGSGVTAWRRLDEWQKAGVWERIHQVLLDELGKRDKIDWERASLDSSTVPTKRGEPDGPRQGRHEALPHCRRPGHPARLAHRRGEHPRHALLRSAHRCHQAYSASARATSPAPKEAPRRQGFRLEVEPPRAEHQGHPGAHRPQGHRVHHEARQAPLGRGANDGVAQPVPPTHGPLRTTCGHPPRLPSPRLRAYMLEPPRAGVLKGALNQFRRLAVRYERRADNHRAFLHLACALTCWNLLEPRF